jgi:hypothetical protein
VGLAGNVRNSSAGMFAREGRLAGDVKEYVKMLTL